MPSFSCFCCGCFSFAKDEPLVIALQTNGTRTLPEILQRQSQFEGKLCPEDETYGEGMRACYPSRSRSGNEERCMEEREKRGDFIGRTAELDKILDGIDQSCFYDPR